MRCCHEYCYCSILLLLDNYQFKNRSTCFAFTTYFISIVVSISSFLHRQEVSQSFDEYHTEIKKLCNDCAMIVKGDLTQRYDDANACKCMQICADAYKCVQMRTNACKCVQMHANGRKWSQMCANVCNCVQMHANMQICADTYKRV